MSRSRGASSTAQTANSGGARLGRVVGTSVGSRSAAIRSTTVASSIAAMSASRPPHIGHASVSRPKLRRIKSAHSRVSPRVDGPADEASPVAPASPETALPAIAR